LIRLKIFKLQAEIFCHEIEMTNDEIQEYQVSLIIDFILQKKKYFIENIK
jgi:hypothetical protein